MLDVRRMKPDPVAPPIASRDVGACVSRQCSLSAALPRPALVESSLPIDRILAITAVYLWPCGFSGRRRNPRG